MGVFTSANAPAAILFALAVGCGGAPLCASSADCAAGRICGLDGRCGALRPPPGARFAASRWLTPIDWGVTGPGPLTDRLRVGEGRESLLAFGPLPEASRVLRARLVLHPHDAAARLDAPQLLVVERTRRFAGGPLPLRRGAQPDRLAAARRALAPGPARTLRVDVTDAARAAGGERLYLLLRAGDAALAYASPNHPRPRVRPRIELLLH